MLTFLVIIVAILMAFLGWKYFGSLFAAVVTFMIAVLVLPLVVDQLGFLTGSASKQASDASTCTGGCNG
jgi:divalent metal cation (Fe/Co/Zn/Cd) transporter